MSEAAVHYERRRLENELVVLEPFDPNIHITHFMEVMKRNPDLLQYIAFPVIDTEAEFRSEFYDKVNTPPHGCLYAIFDKKSTVEEEDTFRNYAGIIHIFTSSSNASGELSVIIFPAFHRTHISTNAIGLSLLRVLDPPSIGGLGLRRVEWKTHTENAASRRAAMRMGFEFEGIARWERFYPYGSAALPVEALEKRNGTKGEVPGRHTAIYSIVWDEWDDKRCRIVESMERKQ